MNKDFKFDPIDEGMKDNDIFKYTVTTDTGSLSTGGATNLSTSDNTILELQRTRIRELEAIIKKIIYYLKNGNNS